MPPPTISELMQIPNGYKTADQTLSDAIARKQQQQRFEQNLQMQVALEAAKQRMEMANPISQSLMLGKMGLMTSDPAAQGLISQPSLDQIMQGNPYARLVGFNPDPQQRPTMTYTQGQQPIYQSNSNGNNYGISGGSQNFNSLNPVAQQWQSQQPKNLIAQDYERTPFGYVPKKVTDINAESQIASSKKNAEVMADETAKANVSKIRDDAQFSLVAQSWKNLIGLHKYLSDKGYAGDIYKSKLAENPQMIPRFGGLQDRLVPPDVQDKSGQFISGKNELIMKTMPMQTQQFGQAGSVRIMDSVLQMMNKEIGGLSTPHQMFLGQAKGTLSTLYRIQQASNKYANDLAESGQQMPNDPDTVAKEIYKRLPDLTPSQEKELEDVIQSTTGQDKNFPINSPFNPLSQKSQSKGKLDENTAKQILKQAGGDNNKARKLATQMGYQF